MVEGGPPPEDERRSLSDVLREVATLRARLTH